VIDQDEGMAYDIYKDKQKERDLARISEIENRPGISLSWPLPGRDDVRLKTRGANFSLYHAGREFAQLDVIKCNFPQDLRDLLEVLHLSIENRDLYTWAEGLDFKGDL
jgi:hypothetical protein